MSEEDRFDTDSDESISYKIYNFINNREIRILISVIGVLSTLMPWIVTDRYGPKESFNLVYYLNSPETGTILLMLIVLFILGMVICTFKSDMSAFVGVPIIWISFLGMVLWKLPKNDIIEAVWGGGVYFALAATLALSLVPLLAMKFSFDDFATPSS